MQKLDVARTILCPLWGLSTWATRDEYDSKKEEKALYGDNFNFDFTPAQSDPKVPLAVLFTILGISLLFTIIFWFWPLIRAFTCGNSPTSLGGTGILWGILIFLFPPLGILFLFLGKWKRTFELPCKIKSLGDALGLSPVQSTTANIPNPLKEKMVPAGTLAAPDSLMQFFRTRNCIIKQGEERKITHMRMDGGYGGKFHIPPEALTEFYTAYGTELYNERPLFYIEKNTPIFMMHFDVDFPSLMEEDRTVAFCETLHAAVAEYFQTPRKAVVCAILDVTGARKGAGLHILFPKTYVNEEMACAVWAGVVARCEEKLPWGRDTWEKVVDVAVLAEKGSLRMVGSDKCVDCPSCHNNLEQKKFCPHCNQRGKISCNKIYWPWKTFPNTPLNQQELDDMRLNKAHAARYCSIQSARDKPSEDFAIPVGAPLAKLVAKCRLTRVGNNAMPMQAPCSEALSLRSEILEALTQSIRNYDSHFGQLLIRDVVKLSSKPPRCWIRVRGYHDRYCLNKGCEHASNQIYFVLTTKGLSQRCYSKKLELRDSGRYCKDFEGPPKPVPDEVITTLLDTPQERRAISPARASKKRPRTEGVALVCYGGFYHISPDLMI